jgi:prepilin-type N-terminal cleavage/methylation domain-containing protein
MKGQRGFTILELLLVIGIATVIVGLVSIRLGTVNYWKDEGEIRKISELIEYLFHQSAIDGYYYRINFAFGERFDSYQIGIVGDEETEEDNLRSAVSGEAGQLSQELSVFLQPTRGRSQSLLPPPDLPSLRDPKPLPEGMRILDVRSPRGLTIHEPGQSAYLDFSPRGFSEFGVVHLETSSGQPVTILINPFSGLTTIYREYRDFDWVWGKQERS